MLIQMLWKKHIYTPVDPLWRIMECCHSRWGFSLTFSSFFSPTTTYQCIPHQPGVSCYLCLNRLSRKCLDKRRELVEHWHTSKRGRRKLRLASVAHRGRPDERWSVEGFLRMKPLEMAVIERSIEGKRGREALGGTESRRDLPVRFRCGKCWLPVDSIRASSGSHVKGWGSEERRGEQKSKEEEQV